MKRFWKTLAVLSVAALAAGAVVYHHHPHAVKAAVCRMIPGKTVRYTGEDIRYADTFNDLNRKHLEAASISGLKEIPETRQDIDRDGLKKISTNRNYCVEPLSYSVPYLMPGAASELDSIGLAFRCKLEENGLPGYRIIVTSVLRTREDVKKLMKANVNSSANSSHCYGSTFDISWSRYDKVVIGGKNVPDSDLKAILGEILKQEKKEGRIYVKYEIRQKCFHITSRI